MNGLPSEIVLTGVVAPAPVATSQQETPVETPARRARPGWRLDLLLFLVLCAAALPLRFAYTEGDLWGDEADYALASARGFQANRWDMPGPSDDPNELVRLRHFHPPMTVYALALARHWGTDDRALRAPFALAGGLTVGLIYLCGLPLFAGRREIAFGCAVVAIVTPPLLRMASHAIPWALITLGLTLLLWTLLQFCQTRRAAWLVGAGAALGGLFVTSEMFFVAAVATGAALPWLLAPRLRAGEERGKLLIGCAFGVAAFFYVAIVFWPVGLSGGAWKMLAHYMAVAKAPVEAMVGGQVYRPAPKWAYLFWYWHLFRPFAVFYAAGLLAASVLMGFRRFSSEGWSLLAFTAVLLAAAHKAHIIGPEYLAHCLPFLTLAGGYAAFALGLLSRPLGFVAMAGACLCLAHWHSPETMAGMDARSRIPRWPAAARFLAERWKPGDRAIIGRQPIMLPRWYLLHAAQIAAGESQARWFWPASPSKTELDDIRQGRVRFVILSSTYSDPVSLHYRLKQNLRRWPLVWQSDERGTGRPRLLIYEKPVPTRAIRAFGWFPVSGIPLPLWRDIAIPLDRRSK